ncbi:MAG: nucleotidyltransferase [Epulopiscium sp. Nuni2H_MBin003]|nr:MAG: nucleotidyltransferase [Epulopiscium sp. Nuni2H_MBin003]
MSEPILVIMAAGIGSRYGGLKQIDPVGSYDELIIDFSIYDAIKAGFKKVAFIIKKQDEQEFRTAIGDRIQKYVEVIYIYQELDNLPNGYKTPIERLKPWGTGQAILCCKEKIKDSFVTINADDFYGYDAFKTSYEYLKEQNQYCMIGYILKNTLSDNGGVTRGVCEVTDGYLTCINERTKVGWTEGKVRYLENEQWNCVNEDSVVSMNMWGFTTQIFKEIEQEFVRFLEKNSTNLTSEFLLTNVIDRTITNNPKSVKVIYSKDKWYGVTYKQDKQLVVDAIKNMQQVQLYPNKLWD